MSDLTTEERSSLFFLCDALELSPQKLHDFIRVIRKFPPGSEAYQAILSQLEATPPKKLLSEVSKLRARLL